MIQRYIQMSVSVLACHLYVINCQYQYFFSFILYIQHIMNIVDSLSRLVICWLFDCMRSSRKMVSTDRHTHTHISLSSAVPDKQTTTTSNGNNKWKHTFAWTASKPAKLHHWSITGGEKNSHLDPNDCLIGKGALRSSQPPDLWHLTDDSQLWVIGWLRSVSHSMRLTAVKEEAG